MKEFLAKQETVLKWQQREEDGHETVPHRSPTRELPGRPMLSLEPENQEYLYVIFVAIEIGSRWAFCQPTKSIRSGHRRVQQTGVRRGE